MIIENCFRLTFLIYFFTPLPPKKLDPDTLPGVVISRRAIPYSHNGVSCTLKDLFSILLFSGSTVLLRVLLFQQGFSQVTYQLIDLLRIHRRDNQESSKVSD